MYSNGKNSEHVQQELLYGQSHDGCVKFFDKSEAVWEGGRERAAAWLVKLSFMTLNWCLEGEMS